MNVAASSAAMRTCVAVAVMVRRRRRTDPAAVLDQVVMN
jgi:hypothetical protein